MTHRPVHYPTPVESGGAHKTQTAAEDRSSCIVYIRTFGNPDIQSNDLRPTLILVVWSLGALTRPEPRRGGKVATLSQGPRH
jgi:hypothetical protein